jgi:hypothetical protein
MLRERLFGRARMDIFEGSKRPHAIESFELWFARKNEYFRSEIWIHLITFQQKRNKPWGSTS